MRRAAVFVGVAGLLLGGLGVALRAEDAKEKRGGKERASVQKKAFGKTPDGEEVDLYTLTNTAGMTAKIMTYGAILTELDVPGSRRQDGGCRARLRQSEGLSRTGIRIFGATVGRVANRIAKGKFTLDGKEYKLAVNNGPNALHGGLKGFDKGRMEGRAGEDAGRRRRANSPTPARTARRAIPAISTSR